MRRLAALSRPKPTLQVVRSSILPTIRRPLVPSGGPAAAEAKAALASEMAAEVLRARGRVAAEMTALAPPPTCTRFGHTSFMGIAET